MAGVLGRVEHGGPDGVVAAGVVAAEVSPDLSGDQSVTVITARRGPRGWVSSASKAVSTPQRRV